MSSLFETIRNNVHWVVLILLEGISLTLLFRYNPYQQSVWFDYATQAAGYIDEQRQQVLYYRQLKEENMRLTEENVTLQQNLRILRRKLKRQGHETTQTENMVAGELANYDLIPALVCSNSVAQRDNVILINRGKEDGVMPQQAVVSGTGVVGIVANVSRNYSLVIPVLNSRSSISCRIRGSEYFGYLHWKGGNPLVAQLDDVPAHSRVKEGDVVETSGFSNIFPEGLFVGKVIKVGYSPDGQSLQLSVNLSTDIANLVEVMVVASTEREDIDKALQGAEEEEN